MPQSRYDLLGSYGNIFYRIQVKKATWSLTGRYKYLQARLAGRTPETHKYYTQDEVDIIAITDLEILWLVPIKEASKMTSICLGSTNPNYKQQTKYDATKWIV